MADKKSIHEFVTGTLNALTAFLVDTPDSSATSGYKTEKVITSDLGEFINGNLEYTQQLDTESKNIFGAVNELNENSVNFEEESIPDIPDRELPYYPSGEYSGLNTNDKHIVGAINELNSNKVGKSELYAWDDITSSVTPTNYITDFVYRINRMTGLKYIGFTIKPGTPDSTVLISPLPNVNFKKITPIPIAMANQESIGLGNFSCYFYPDGNVIFRCKTPTVTSSLFVVGFLL